MLLDRTAIHGNIDPKLLESDIKYAQDVYIFPLLGTALMNKIQAYIVANNWTGGTNYKALLDNYLVDCLIWFTLSESQLTMSFQLSNKGIIRKQGDNLQLPSMSEIMQLASDNKKRAEFYANRAKLYIVQNAPAMFPEYLNPGSGVDAKYPDKVQYSNPIYLGGSTPCRNGDGNGYGRGYGYGEYAGYGWGYYDDFN